MNKEIKQLVICEKTNSSSSELGDIVAIYEDDTIDKITYNKAKKIMNKMYISNLSPEEVDSKILFLTDEEFYNYIDNFTDEDIDEEKEYYSSISDNYYKNPNIDYDDIDSGLSIEDIKDPRRVREKMGLLRKIKVRAFSIFLTTTVVAGGTAFCVYKLKRNNDISGHLIKSSTIKEETSENPNLLKVKEKDFYSLLNESNNNQNCFMNSINVFLTFYNNAFAKKHKEDGIKPALKWDEAISLKLAYNNLANDQINDAFNGEKIDYEHLVEEYKNSVNQLSKAFILENKKSLVSLDLLIDSADDKRIFDNINYKYLNIKEKDFSNEEKLNKFYKKLYKNVNNNKYSKFYLEPIFRAASKSLKSSKYENSYKDLLDEYYNGSDFSNDRNFFLKSVSELSSGNVNEKTPLYKEFKKTKIDQMKKDNVYNIKNRNIELLSEYDKNLDEIKVDKDYKSKAYKYTK